MEASLETLPTEILFKVFSLLDAQFIVNVVSKLCTRFARMLGDDSFWQAKFVATWSKPYPVPIAEDFDWKEACVEREHQFNLWTNWEDKMRSVHIMQAHSSTINSVLLMNGGSTCVTASRDRSIKIWCSRDEPAAERNRLLHSFEDAHRTWVWTLRSMGGTLISSSLDSTVKLWDVERGLHELKSFTMDRPALAMSQSDREMILGCFNGTLYRYDPREPGEPSSCCNTLRRAIVCMAADDRVVLAGTTEPGMHVIERRCWKRRRSVHIPEDYPTALSFDSRQLWMGTRNGNVHVIDMTTSRCKILQTIDSSSLPAQRRNVTAICHTLGSVLVSFEHAPMVVLEPTLSPGVMFKGPEQQRVIRFDFEGGTLALAQSEDLQIWWPKREAEAV